MNRSFWRIPRTAWLTTDEDGNEAKAFRNVVVFGESPQFLYVIAAEEERPDIAAVGTLLGDTVKAMNAKERARFLRVEVERDGPDGKERAIVKPADQKPGDVQKRTDVPAVMWAGDDEAEYLP